MTSIAFLQLALLQFLLFTLVHSISNTWINHGCDLFNSRYAVHEHLINTTSASQLTLKWRFVTGFDISATPAIGDGILYFPSWNGNLYAVTVDSGSLVWMKNLTQLTGILYGDHQRGSNMTLSRATPTIAGDKLIVGLYGPAVVLAVDRATGNLLWLQQVVNFPGALITMSGTAYNGGFYVGTSTVEESFPPDLCCTSQGTFLKMDLETGNIIWRTLMLPDNNGSRGLYSGASIWGSSPSIDIKRNLVFIATGELHSVPPAIAECQAEQNKKTIPDFPDPCIEPGNHEESILALDLETGHIIWYHQLGGYDAWVSACGSKNASVNASCPVGPNPDYDFSDAPSMLTIEYSNQSSHYLRDIVVAGQKSGQLWALDRDTGELVWSSVTGPGGGGGQIWGTATDGERIFVNIPNSRHRNWTLLPTDSVITTGGWSAVNASSGAILWSVPNPTLLPSIGPVSLANGVVFATSMDPSGTVFALDAITGSILWNATTNATIYGGCSISDGCVYVGCGASVNAGRGYGGTHGDGLYAFCIPN